MFRKNIYRWHRTCSLVIAIPVLLWALSGFMHPLMTNIRPKIATQVLQPVVIDSSKIKIPLETALLQNGITSFTSFRIVHIADNWFYQVQPKHNAEPLYFATLSGKPLTSGNWLYAQWLARQFLEGQKKDGSTNLEQTKITSTGGHDCCDAATDCVLNTVKTSKVEDASLVTDYNDEYKSINRLLPVYRVAFNRADGIRIYVDPLTDRFAFAMDNKRRIFDRVFTLVHTWSWLDFLGRGRFVVEFVLVGLAFLTTLMGIYIFFSTKSKKVKNNGLAKARRNHRYTSIVVAVFTLMFTFSGAYHALSKLKTDDRAGYYVSDVYNQQAIHFNFLQIQAHVKDPVVNIGLVTIDGTKYWRVQTRSLNSKQANAGTDLMKDAAVARQSISYLSADSSYKALPNGEEAYAAYLARRFSKAGNNAIQSVRVVTKFNSEYNFADKRLPVWRVEFASDNHERLFVETATGSLTKRLYQADLLQDYSFAFLHKHEFLGWAGKGWKDFSTMFWALAQVVMVAVGLVLYFTWKKRV